MFSSPGSRRFVLAIILTIAMAMLPCLSLLPRSISARANAPAQPQTKPYRTGEVLVRFKEGTPDSDKEYAATNHRARRRHQLRGISGIEKFELSGNDDAQSVAVQLTVNPNVEYAEPNFLVTKDQVASTLPNDPRFAEQWAINNIGQNGGQIGADVSVMEAWAKTTGSQSTTIAVIDSGVDFTHPELINNEWTNSNPTNGDIHGWDYITDSGNIKDEAGHGTAIAGIIAAQGNNNIGVSGVMWRASLMSLRVLDSTGTGDVADAVEAIDYAITHGAQVINLSWGTPAQSLALKDALKRATHRGVLVVSSAGNNGQDLSSQPYYPASYNISGLVSVAGTDHFDNLASWSNWSGQDIALAAPGVDILTTQMGKGYGSVSGTSAAAPLVSGIAGLIKTLNPTLDPRRLAKALSDGARKVPALSGKVASAGVVNASGALAQIRDITPSGLPAPTPAYNNANGQSGNSNLPPGLGDGNNRLAKGKDGKRDTAPASKAGAPLAHLPELSQSRKTRKSPKTSKPTAPIHANLICADCDPSGGGGAGGGYPSDPYFGTARTRPVNRTGESNVALGSRNINWGLPLVSLPGRAGLDLTISLYYNSLVWTKQDSGIEYNADHGSPAPGFQIGLPRLQAQFYNSDANAYSYMMIDPSGGRVEMRQVGSGTYESTDGTFTQLTFSGSTPVVRTTDGTQYIFGTAVGAEWRCTQVEDRNGNYISASYNTSNGHVLTITDTLGRVLNFGYDGDGNLYNITQDWGGTTHWWATFIYGQVYMSYNFSGLSAYGATNGSYQTVLAYVVVSNNKSYHFDYNSYGQVYQIRHKAPDGHELEHAFYNIDTSSAQSDCPKYSERRDYAQDWNSNQEAITSYSVNTSASWTNPETGAPETGTLVQETSPDGTVYCEYSHSSGWDAGLTRLSEWWYSTRKKWVSNTWTQDNTSLPVLQNPRLIETNIYDDAGNRSRTTIEYNSGYGLPTQVREYSGSNGQTFLRLKVTDYHLESDYVNRRVIGLPYQQLVYDGPSGGLLSKVQYYFDWDGGGDMFADTPAPATQHDRTNYGPSFLTGRGNLSDIIQYDVINDPNNYNGTAHETKFRYSTTGSLLMKRDARGHASYLDYADHFSDGVNRNTFAYPTTMTDGDGYSSTTYYKYDFGAVTRTHSPTSGTGGGITYLDVTQDYDDYGRVEWIRNQTNSAYRHFVYQLDDNYVHTYETIVDLAHELHSWQIMDGAGRVRASAAEHPNSDAGFTGAYVIYDNMGRVSQQSNPTEMNSSWSPAGDDSIWRTNQQYYDWKGRLRQVTNTDGTTQVFTFGGCGCAGGEVTTVQDEHGRQKRYTKDSLGRLAAVEELNWDSSVYATTSYSYNALNQLTQTNQSGQVRTLDYDGFGRLWRRTTPEQGQTTYSYYADDTPYVITDARGATTTYEYNGRHQATSIAYGAYGGATATANVSFLYDAAGNRFWMVDGLGYGSYSYNNLGQMTSESRYFGAVGSWGALGWFNLSYSYNLAGELASVTNHWGAQVGYDYDTAGRLRNVTGSGYAGVSNYANSVRYSAFGAVRSMNYGDNTSLSTAYDGRLRPTTWNVSNVLGYNYAYDYFNEHTGRVSYAGSLYDSSLDRSYEYDQVGRLATSHSGAEARAAAWTGQWGTMDGPYSQGYVFDVWGNMTQRYGWGGEVQGGGAGETSYHNYYYTNNRRDGFTYDAAGNLTNDLGQNFAYDVTGQQTSASYGGYSLDQYYDGDGLRLLKNDNGTITYYLRSSLLGGQVVAELNNGGGWMRGYVYEGGSLLAVQQGGVYWVHEDPVTNSKRTTDISGYVVSGVEQDPWGADTNRSSNQYFQPHRFTSYERDGNQSDEAMFRRYNRWHSRFDQPDPYGGSYNLSDPQSFNRYAYVQNDPVSFRDATGLDGDPDFGLGPPPPVPILVPPRGPLPVITTNTWASSGSGVGFLFGGDVDFMLELGSEPGGGDGGGGGPQNPAQPTKPATDPRCDARIAAIFGGPGAVAATVYEPPGVNAGAARYRYDHLAGQGVFHIYTDANGSDKVTGLFIPKGGRMVSGGEYDNHGDTENYFRFSYSKGPYKGVQVSLVHVGGTHGGDEEGQYLGNFHGEKNAMGSIRIGNIAGLGGEGKGYNHTHVKVYLNGKLTDPRKVFCK